MSMSLIGRARKSLATQHEDEGARGLEGGFTLIELMVVLLIIAILLAIAIPSFLSVSGGAKDRAAQSNLTNALTDAIAYYQNAQTYDASSTTALSQSGGSPTTASALQSAEPTFTWGTGACVGSSSSNCVSVLPVDVAAGNDGQGIVLAVLSANSNTCWFAANLQAAPATPPASDVGAANDFSHAASGNGSETGATTAGTFYAKKTSDGSSCQASQVQSQAWSWGTSYSNAPAN